MRSHGDCTVIQILTLAGVWAQPLPEGLTGSAFLRGRGGVGLHRSEEDFRKCSRPARDQHGSAPQQVNSFRWWRQAYRRLPATDDGLTSTTMQLALGTLDATFRTAHREHYGMENCVATSIGRWEEGWPFARLTDAVATLQPSSQKFRTPTVAKEFQVGLCGVVEADWENSFATVGVRDFWENGCS